MRTGDVQARLKLKSRDSVHYLYRHNRLRKLPTRISGPDGRAWTLWDPDSVEEEALRRKRRSPD